MGKMYMLLAIKDDGTVRCNFTTEPIIPHTFVQPGETVILIEPIDMIMSDGGG